MTSSATRLPPHVPAETRPDPAMSNTVDADRHTRVTARWIEQDGEPVIPVSGEMHYSRVPRAQWAERLGVMRAAGVTMVATYVPWIHHQPTREAPRFDGQLDLGAFITTAADAGLDVAVRLGPWCHGEMRNGGLPDWVLADAPATRCDDPVYLSLVDDWFARIGAVVAPHCGPDGSVAVIQIENELHDQPGHISTLKATARRHGMTAPLWTATAWGAAELPPHEVLPVFAGYSDGFWADPHAGWEDSFRQHFFFSDVWDDPGVGADQRDRGPIVVKALDPEFPPTTCELGGGMATAYHRRPVPAPRDVAAVANVKLGSGSAWQGFYMFAGGTNPADDLQESHATGYPNDLPRFDYDFHAPISAVGTASGTLALLRQHNAFLAAFGGRLAPMPALLPADRPQDLHDVTTPRCAFRSDGSAGFLFVSSHQPHEPMSTARGVQWSVEVDGQRVDVPDRPIDLPSGVIGRWPVALRVGGVVVRWSTASALCTVDGAVPLLVLVAHDGVTPRIDLGDAVVETAPAGDGPAGTRDGGRAVSGPFDLTVDECVRIDGRLDVLVVDEERAARLWCIDGVLVETAASEDLVWRRDDLLLTRGSAAPALRTWSSTARTMLPLDVTGTPASGPVGVTVVGERAAQFTGAGRSYGSHQGRDSAPSRDQFDAAASVHRLLLPAATTPDARRIATVVWDGDVAELRVDGRTVADRFWDGTPWQVDVTGIPDDAVVTLHLLPLGRDQSPDLWPEAVERRHGLALHALREVRMDETTVWSARGVFGHRAA